MAVEQLLPYQVINEKGVLVLQDPETCRHSKAVELDHLEHGYTIKLHGKRLTKKEVNSRAK